MEYALNKKGEMVNIQDSIVGVEYTCPVCGDFMLRKVGKDRQYYSHRISKENTCELKLYEMLKVKSSTKEDILLHLEESDFMDKVYANYLNEDIPNINGTTEEQLNFINSQEKRIKCNAVAGSGKSSTLYQYLKKRPFQKKLYIVFNVNMMLEAREKFSDIPNLDIRTNFSLAFKYEGFKYKDRIKNTLSIYDYCKLANVFAKTPEDFEYVETLKYFYDLWLASEKLTFEDFFKDEKCSRYTQKGVETIWNNMKDIKSKHPVTHQFYMKAWGLRQPDLSKDYDIIGCDEFQDVSMILSNIIINCKVDTVVCVFDPKQELYSFANPKSGAELLGDEFVSYPLSYCFRIGNTLADISVKIFEYFEKKPFKFIGMNKEQRIVKYVDRNKKHVVLCRSNYEILMQAINYVSEGKVFNIEGRKELNYDFSTIEHVYKFKYYGDKALFLKRFESYEQMKNCMLTGNRVFDMELSSAIKVVEELGSKTLDKLNELKSKLTSRESADVIFSTTHQAKGLTIKEPVVIADDYINIFSILESKDEFEFSEVKDALFLLYVALSRSCGDVEVNDATLMFYEAIVNNTTVTNNEFDKLIKGQIKELKNDMYNWKE